MKLSAILLLLSIPLHSQNCKTSDYRGVYSAVVTGEFIAPPPGLPPGPNARVGRVEADGNGNAVIHAFLSLNGFIAEEHYGGVYSVNPDCSMDVTLFIPFPGAPAPIPGHFKGVLFDSSRRASLLLMDPAGTTFHISLTQQLGHCDLKGNYVLEMSGPIFRRTGRLSFDRGLFLGLTHVSYAGDTRDEALAGTYAIGEDCMVTLNAGAFTLRGMLFNGGANLLLTDPPGSVIAGTLESE